MSCHFSAKNMVFYNFLLFILGWVNFVSAQTPPGSSLPVFPGATGFGTMTTAGSGRHLMPAQTTVMKITSLADKGKGTLRECVERNAPRVCVFEISGRIKLTKQLLISKPFLTIAGQTAPAPGILITGAGIRVATHDVLIQHLQIRVGDDKKGPKPDTRDALTVAGSSTMSASNVVLDHLSISWAIDENFSLWYNTTSDVTLSNSIVAEALYRSIHPKGPHSMGMLIGDGAKRVSVHHNLLAHNNDRNPRLKPGSETEFISNVVYSWGGTTAWNQANLSDTEGVGEATYLAFIGNFYKPGPNSPQTTSIYAQPPAPSSRVYVLSNLGVTRTAESQGEWLISGLPESPYRASTPPFNLSGVLPSAPVDTYQQVLQRAGSRPRESNAVDDRIVSEVTTGAGTIKDCVSGCSRPAGGYPTVATVRRTLTIPNSPNSDDDSDGYTNLEEWLHQLAAAVE